MFQVLSKLFILAYLLGASLVVSASPYKKEAAFRESRLLYDGTHAPFGAGLGDKRGSKIFEDSSNPLSGSKHIRMVIHAEKWGGEVYYYPTGQRSADWSSFQYLEFSAKSDSPEVVLLRIRDKRSRMTEKAHNLFLTKSYQTYRIPLASLSKGVDLRSILRLRFKYGHKFKARHTIDLDNIRLVRDELPKPEKTSSPSPLNILFVGNSFTGMAGVPQLVGYQAELLGIPRPSIQKVTKGGARLSLHLKEGDAAKIIEKGKLDILVLQEFSTEPTSMGSVDQFFKSVTTFYDMAKRANPNTRIVLYETWARKAGNSLYTHGRFASPAEMQKQLRENYGYAAAKYIPQHSRAKVKTDVSVAPVGSAFETYYANHQGLVSLHGKDGYHASPQGACLASYVIFAKIFRQSVAGLSCMRHIPVDLEQDFQVISDRLVLNKSH